MSEDVARLVQQILDHPAESTRAAARLMTMLENQPARITDLHAGQAEWPEPQMVLGITGPPGAGKSTLVDQLVETYRKRHPEKRLGVIAVDPSSPFTKGSVMGDRIRMMRHATDPMVFVRSLAARGHLGGLALGVRGILRVMGLMGCQLIVIETVGVGQSEMEITEFADLVAIVLAPGQGDGIQLMKSGLMETGDVYVINKADRDGAAQLQSQLLATLNLTMSTGNPGRAVPLCLTSALQGEGITEFLDLLELKHAQGGETWLGRRRQRFEQDIVRAVLQEAEGRLAETLRASGLAASGVERVLRGETTVSELASALIELSAQDRTKNNEGLADEQRSKS